MLFETDYKSWGITNTAWPMVIFHYFSVMECDLQLQYNLEIASRISRAFDNGTKSREIFVYHSYCNNSYWGWDVSENNLYHEWKIKFSLKTWVVNLTVLLGKMFQSIRADNFRIQMYKEKARDILYMSLSWAIVFRKRIRRILCSVAMVKAVSSERVYRKTGKNLNCERICLFELPVYLCSKPLFPFSWDSLTIYYYLPLTRRLRKTIVCAKCMFVDLAYLTVGRR